MRSKEQATTRQQVFFIVENIVILLSASGSVVVKDCGACMTLGCGEDSNRNGADWTEFLKPPFHIRPSHKLLLLDAGLSLFAGAFLL